LKKLLGKLTVAEKWITAGRYEQVYFFMKQKEIKKFISKFNKTSKHDMTDNKLDIAEKIIKIAKDLDELDFGGLTFTPAVPDTIYDELLERYKKFRSEMFSTVILGTTNVSYQFKTLAGTLDKAHFVYDKDVKDDRISIEELFKDVDESKQLTVKSSEKMDGVSLNVSYKIVDIVAYANKGLSRGDVANSQGGDVTNVTIGMEHDITKLVKKYELPDEIGVQYEMTISSDNKLRFEAYYSRKPYVNKRAAASALLKKLTFAKNKDEIQFLQSVMSLTPVGFEFDGMDEYDRFELFDDINKAFYTNQKLKTKIYTGNKKEILKKIAEEIETKSKERETLDYATDGVVIEIGNKSIRKSLGRDKGINKFQIAYKFPSMCEKSKVTKVQIEVGTAGYAMPMVYFDPIVLNGGDYDHASLGSFPLFEKMHIHRRDDIMIEYSNEVIPVAFKDENCIDSNNPLITLNMICPECKKDLVQVSDKRYRCTNLKCRCRVVGKMIKFVDSVGCKGIGIETVRQFYDELKVTTIDKMLEITDEQLYTLKKFKTGKVNNTRNSINYILKEKIPQGRFLGSLSIDNLGKRTAKKVIEKIGFEKLLKLVYSKDVAKLSDELSNCEGVDTLASSIAVSLIEERDLIKILLSKMNVKGEKVKEKQAKTALCSGIRDDKDLEDHAYTKGYNVIYSGSKFDILIIKNESYRSKGKAITAKAKELPIYLLEDFMK
jgi:NAD-dependent DNA ligase